VCHAARSRTYVLIMHASTWLLRAAITGVDVLITNALPATYQHCNVQVKLLLSSRFYKIRVTWSRLTDGKLPNRKGLTTLTILWWPTPTWSTPTWSTPPDELPPDELPPDNSRW